MATESKKGGAVRKLALVLLSIAMGLLCMVLLMEALASAVPRGPGGGGGAVASPPGEIIIDDGDPGFSFTPATGIWWPYPGPPYPPGGWNEDYMFETSDVATATARWTPNIPEAGFYRVSVHWSVYSSRPPSVPYMIVCKSGVFTHHVDQTKDANGNPVPGGGPSGWEALGVYPFVTGTIGYVELNTSSPGHTCADAVKFSFTPGPPHTTTVTAHPRSIPADGISTSTITATVVDEFGYYVDDGTVVTFTTDLGSLGSDMVTKTTTSGVATATLTSGLVPGVATITATANVTATDVITVSFLPPEVGVRKLVVPTGSVEPGELITYTLTYSNSGEGTATGVVITDIVPLTLTNLSVVTSGATITRTPGVTYAWSVADLAYGEGGVITITGRVDPSKPVSQSAVLSNTVEITATYDVSVANNVDTVSNTVIPGAPYSVEVSADPEAIRADGVSTSTITAEVRDRFGNSVLNGTVVTFTTDLGSLGSEVVTKTTTSGVAKATLASTTTLGTAVVTAMADSKVDTTTVKFAYIIDDGDPEFSTIGAWSVYTPTPNGGYENDFRYAAAPATATARWRPNLSTPGNYEIFAHWSVSPTRPMSVPYKITYGGGFVATRYVDQTKDAQDIAQAAFTPSGWKSLGVYNFIAGTSGYVELDASKCSTGTVCADAIMFYLTGIPGPPYTVELKADPEVLSVDGSSELTAEVKDQYGNPVSDGTEVTFTTSLGSVGSETVVKETVGGVATATLSSEEPGVAVVTATSDSRLDTVVVTFTAGAPYSMEVSADPGSIPVGGYTSTITAEVTDRYGNWVEDGTEVVFSTDLGSLGSDMVTKTTTSGVATATLTSGLVPGVATITATANVTATDVITVSFLPPEVGVRKLVVPTGSVEPGELITYTLTYSNSGEGTATGVVITDIVPLTLTNLSVVTSGATITRTPGVTYAWSVADLAYGEGGVITITGRVDPSKPVSQSAVLSNAVEITATYDVSVANNVDTVSNTVIPGAPYSVEVSADPEAIRADGVSTSTITAEVRDRFGNSVLNGTVVTFTTDLGSLGSKMVTKTATSGVAKAILRSGTTAGIATVTATADSKFGTTTVTFIPGPPYTVELGADPEVLSVDDSSELRAEVEDQYGNPVSDGTVVTFTTSLGSLGSDTVTKTTLSGVATATLSSEEPGVAVVTATSDSRFDTVVVTFTAGAPYSMEVSADPGSIPVGGYTSTVRAEVRDRYGNWVEDGTEVVFSTDLGSLGSDMVTKTTTSGVATATLTSGTTAGTATVTATADSASGTCTVKFTAGEPSTMTITAYPMSIRIGGFTSTITATVKDQYDNPVEDGTAVDFYTTLLGGVLDPFHTSTTNGAAVTTLTSGSQIGTGKVCAIADSLRECTGVMTFTVGLPYHVDVEAHPASIGLNDSSMIVAEVKDIGGNWVEDGTMVTFATSMGSLGSEVVTKTTTSGVATATLTSGTTAGTATVTATADSKFGICTVEFLPDPPYTVTVTADPEAIPANGVSTSTITAQVTDRYGNWVRDGTEVAFATTAGSFPSNPYISTTANGVATATLTSSTTPGSATVTATADGRQGQTEVDFYYVWWRWIYLPLIVKNYP